MSVAEQGRGKDKGAVEAVPDRPDISLAEHLESRDAEAKAEIDRGLMADMIEDRRRDIEKALEEERRRALEEERRQALKEERQRAIDWQIMVGNHRDLANVYARSMLLQSC